MRLLWNLKREEEEREREREREGWRRKRGSGILVCECHNIQVCDFVNNLLMIVTVCYWIIASQLLVMSFSSV